MKIICCRSDVTLIAELISNHYKCDEIEEKMSKSTENDEFEFVDSPEIIKIENPKSKATKSKKKVKIAVTFNPQISCPCKKRCAERIDVVSQRDVFNIYHGYSKWTRKVLYLRSIVERKAAKENLNPRQNIKKKDYYSSYFLTDEYGKRQQVCSSFVSKILQINRVKLFRAIQSEAKNPAAVDRRGKLPSRKTKPNDIRFLKEFIQSLPRYESKFDSQPSDSKFFHPKLNIGIIYRLYKEKCIFQNQNVLLKTTFNTILKSNFGFLKPFIANATCQICNQTKKQMKPKVISDQMKENIKTIQDEHLLAARKIKEKFLKSIDLASEIEVEVISFELQHVLEMPFVSIDESYEWNQLWCSNFCVFDEIRRKAFTFFWDESIAPRGPEEIASCLFRYISQIVPKNVKKIICYSKAAPSYRNVRMTLMLKKLFDFLKSSSLEEIEQRFFVPGHDGNGCSDCFGRVNHGQRTSLFVPDNWISTISQTEPTCTIMKMTGNEFYSVEQLIPIVSKENSDIGAQNIDWSKIQSITINQKEPMTIIIKDSTDDSETYAISNLSPSALQNGNLVYSYKTGNAISKFKYDGLQKILKYVPIEHHDFYTSLKYNENIMNKDFALVSQFDYKECETFYLKKT